MGCRLPGSRSQGGAARITMQQGLPAHDFQHLSPSLSAIGRAGGCVALVL